MSKQILFALTLLTTLSLFSFTVYRLAGFFSYTRKGFPIRDIGKRISVTLNVAIGQTKIFRRPVIGLIHALVFWGFCVILIGSIEMVIDGLAGSDRALKALGIVYNLITGSGDIFALVIAVSIVVFLIRRIFFHIERFEGIEMKRSSHIDANIALTMILLLMVTLLGFNTAYVSYSLSAGETMHGMFPVSRLLSGLFTGIDAATIHLWHEGFWWSHILLIFIFANMLPYSKHFHVFLSVPNVFLSRLEPLGKLPNMDNVTREVRLMMNPETAYSAAPSDAPLE
ncbi:MAG: Fe-S oxidoreductase, partial [Bacteroidales bacterium]|nr:Fe-S oxidoreductase [Bacteroidales bacterium]